MFGLPRVATRRDDRLDATCAQPLPDTPRIVATADCQPFRTTPGAPRGTRNGDLVHQGFDLGCLLPLTGGEAGIERKAALVADEMDFGAEAAGGASKGMVVGLVIIVVVPPFPLLPQRDGHGPHFRRRTIVRDRAGRAGRA